MPDVIATIGKRWKLILSLTLLAALLSFIACLLSPKEYVGIATALPVNTLVNDKARLFNTNIEALYAEIGTADELDKIEGTSKLDTIFIAAVTGYGLAAHYGIDTTRGDALEKAVLKLKKNSSMYRTGFGEFQIKVWDRDNILAAGLANGLMQKINEVHQGIQSERTSVLLETLRVEKAAKEKELVAIETNLMNYEGANSNVVQQPLQQKVPTHLPDTKILQEQVNQYQRLIYQYELALQTGANVLTFVEHARPSPWADKPKTLQTVVLSFFSALLFSFLLALFVESRKGDV